MLPVTIPEVRHLLWQLTWHRVPEASHVLYWSYWRRMHRAVARYHHYRRRGATLPQLQL